RLAHGKRDGRRRYQVGRPAGPACLLASGEVPPAHRSANCDEQRLAIISQRERATAERELSEPVRLASTGRLPEVMPAAPRAREPHDTMPFLPCDSVPQPHCPVLARGGQRLAVRKESESQDLVRVPQPKRAHAGGCALRELIAKEVRAPKGWIVADEPKEDGK